MICLAALLMVNLNSFARRVHGTVRSSVQKVAESPALSEEILVEATDDIKTAAAKTQAVIADAEQKIAVVKNQLKTGDISPVDAAKKIGEYNYVIERQKKQLAELVHTEVDKVEAADSEESYLNQLISGAQNLGASVIAPFKSGYGYSEEEQAIARSVLAELYAQLKEIEEGSIVAQQQAKSEEEKDKFVQEYNAIKQTIEEEIHNQQIITGEAMSNNRKLFWAAVGVAGTVVAGTAAQYYLAQPKLPVLSPDTLLPKQTVAEGLVQESSMPTTEPVSKIDSTINIPEQKVQNDEQNLNNSDIEQAEVIPMNEELVANAQNSSTKSAAERIIWPRMEEAERAAQLAREEKLQQQLEKRARDEQISEQQIENIKRISAPVVQSISESPVPSDAEQAEEYFTQTYGPAVTEVLEPMAEQLTTETNKAITNISDTFEAAAENSRKSPSTAQKIWADMEAANQAQALENENKLRVQQERNAASEQLTREQLEKMGSSLRNVPGDEQQAEEYFAQTYGSPSTTALKQVGRTISESMPSGLDASEQELGTPDTEYLGTPQAREELRAHVQGDLNAAHQRLGEMYEEAPTASAAERIIWPQMEEAEREAQLAQEEKLQQQLEKRARDEQHSEQQIENIKRISAPVVQSISESQVPSDAEQAEEYFAQTYGPAVTEVLEPMKTETNKAITNISDAFEAAAENSRKMPSAAQKIWADMEAVNQAKALENENKLRLRQERNAASEQLTKEQLEKMGSSLHNVPGDEQQAEEYFAENYGPATTEILSPPMESGKRVAQPVIEALGQAVKRVPSEEDEQTEYLTETYGPAVAESLYGDIPSKIKQERAKQYAAEEAQRAAEESQKTIDYMRRQQQKK